MPATKVVKEKPVEASRKSTEKPKPVSLRVVRRAENEAAPRRNRGSSCPRCPPRGRSEAGIPAAVAPEAANKFSPVRRSRSSSTAHRSAATCPGPVPRPCRQSSAGPGQEERTGARGHGRYLIHSHKAFTVIAPNPKKRREIQKKAEAELAALEELRLSRTLAYVSIDPSSVGGCMSLEEVRLKQQQEMMEARGKQKQIKKLVMEEASVLTS